MKKEPTFCDATTGFSAKWRLGNKRRSPFWRRTWLVMPRGNCASTNQKYYPVLESVTSSVWNFCARFLDVAKCWLFSQSNCGIKVILMLVWLCYNCFFFTERMHSVVVRYYHVHTKSTENVPSLWYKTACKSSRLLTYSLFVTNKLSGR